ncbi:TlpA disulfide reductase family protein [Chitinophaga sp. YIM B06452]|uniref:TlpA disulfide reductase family protein n=1 Tax=Chitinophaga sp. YIM B06452 TaxID=3082158 RepID=UPI0031FEFDBD
MLRYLNILVLYTFVLVVLMGFSFSQKQPNFILKAKINGIPDETTVCLLLNQDTVGMTKSKNGEFEFSGNVKGGADFYFFNFIVNGREKFSNALWLENKEMIVTGDIDKLNNLNLEGSNSQKEYMEVMGIPSEKGDTSVMLYKEFVKKHPNSLYIPNLILRMVHTYNEKELELVYNSLSNASKATRYGVQLGQEVERRLKYKDFYKSGLVGSVLPDFQITTSNGKIETLHNITSRNKFTLIDFWASWCRPCRAEVPRLINVYNDFNAKGFGIVGISIDKSHSAWKKAMLEDKAPWIQTIDNLVDARSNILKMDAIPGYILVDSKSKVISADYFSSALMIRPGLNGGNLRDSLNHVISILLK